MKFKIIYTKEQADAINTMTPLDRRKMLECMLKVFDSYGGLFQEGDVFEFDTKTQKRIVDNYN